MKKYKYIAVLTCYSGLTWSHDTIEIQVNSEEDAKKWIEENTNPSVDYVFECLKENKEG